MNNVTHTGGCHCGQVKFSFEGPSVIDAIECNCSMCAKFGYWHYFLPKTEFTLLQGEEMLTTYTFNTGVAQHYFCKVCGVKSFYVPRSHPDQYSINVRCLDSSTVEAVNITLFDGQNWEQNVESIR